MLQLPMLSFGHFPYPDPVQSGVKSTEPNTGSRATVVIGRSFVAMRPAPPYERCIQKGFASFVTANLLTLTVDSTRRGRSFEIDSEPSGYSSWAYRSAVEGIAPTAQGVRGFGEEPATIDCGVARE